MFPYDNLILAAIANTPATVPDVVKVLQTIDSTCIPTDGLKWFNQLYLQVTQAVLASVASGGFTDPAWIAALDVEFAKLYLSALRSSLSGGALPHCWQVVFERRSQVAIARIQFALSGINAHINHDLPEALVNTCRLTGTAPDHGSVHYQDYTAVNATLDTLVNAAKSALNVRLPGDALPPLTHLEDTLAAWNVTAAREAAWQNAEHLWHLQSVPLLAGSFMDVLDGLTTVISKTLLTPVP
jgi:hypothetical protein